MAPLPTPSSQFSQDIAWSSLKQAIASSSGFQRWRIEQGFSDQQIQDNLDALVNRYLRQTLETLAY